MTSEIIPTLKCCIDSIQLKLYDFGMEKLDFEKILNERFKRGETPRNVNKNLSLLADNHFQYLNPVCPHCNSNKVTKQGFQERNPIIDDSKLIKIYQQIYKCKKCHRKFTTSLDSIIKPHHRYANLFKEKLENFIQTGYRSLRKIMPRLPEFLWCDAITPNYTKLAAN